MHRNLHYTAVEGMVVDFFEVRLASFSYSDWCLRSLFCMKSIKKYLVG